MKSKRRVGWRLAVRVSWNVVDQGLSAVSNVALTVVIARSADVDGFGQFAVAFLIFSLLVGFARSVIGQPLQVRASDETASHRRDYQEALGASVIIGAIGAILLALTAAVIRAHLGKTLLVVGLCLPLLLLQDTCRFVFFSSDRANRAAANDALWTLVEFVLLGIMVQVGIRDAAVLALAWGVGAAVAAMYGMYQLGLLPVFASAASWVWRQRDLGGYFAAEFVLGQGAGQASVLLLGFVGTTSGLGSLRAAQVLLGPLAICGAAAFTFTIPEVARRPNLSGSRRQQISWLVAAAMGAVTALYAGVLLLLPDQLGVALLGDTWRGASQVLLAASAAAFANAVSTGPAAVMYGLGRARATFGLHLLAAPLIPIGVLLGNALGSTSGAAWGIAIASAIVVPAWFYLLHGMAQGETH